MEKLKKLYNFVKSFIQNMKLNQILFWIAVLFIGLTVFLTFQLKSVRRQLDVQRNLVSSLNSEAEVWRDKDSILHAKIQIIETENVKEFLAIKNVDESVKALQAEVKKFQKYLKNVGSVTMVSSTTTVDTTLTSVTTSKDTIKIRDTIKIFPEYRRKFNLQDYVFGNIIADKDSVRIQLKIKNDYSIVIGEENKGPFRRGKPFAEVINNNPYSDLLNIKTYQVKSYTRKRFSIGPVVGGGFNQDWKFQPFIGLGFTYNLISF